MLARDSVKVESTEVAPYDVSYLWNAMPVMIYEYEVIPFNLIRVDI